MSGVWRCVEVIGGWRSVGCEGVGGEWGCVEVSDPWVSWKVEVSR